MSKFASMVGFTPTRAGRKDTEMNGSDIKNTAPAGGHITEIFNTETCQTYFAMVFYTRAEAEAYAAEQNLPEVFDVAASRSGAKFGVKL